MRILIIFLLFICATSLSAQINNSTPQKKLNVSTKRTNSFISDDKHILFINDVSRGSDRLVKKIDLKEYGTFPETLTIENGVITVKLIKGKKPNTSCTLYFDVYGNLKLKVDEKINK